MGGKREGEKVWVSENDKFFPSLQYTGVPSAALACIPSGMLRRPASLWVKVRQFSKMSVTTFHIFLILSRFLTESIYLIILGCEGS